MFSWFDFRFEGLVLIATPLSGIGHLSSNAKSELETYQRNVRFLERTSKNQRGSDFFSVAVAGLPSMSALASRSSAWAMTQSTQPSPSESWSSLTILVSTIC